MDILQGQYSIEQMKSLYRPLIHAYGENVPTTFPYPISRFIYDIYINGQFIIREFKVWKTGNSSNPYSWMDVAPVIRNYISATFKNGMYPAYIQYQIQYGYEDTSGTLYPNVQNENSFAWNGYPSFSNEDLINDIGGTPYITYQGMYMSTYRNRVLPVYGNYSTFVPLFKGQIYYSSNFNYYYNGNYYNLNDSLNNLGIYNHEVKSTDFDWIGVLPENQIFSYDVDGDPIGNMPNSQVLFQNPCTKNNPVMLHFLNQLGGIESFLFSGVNKDNTNIVRNAYSKIGITEHETFTPIPPFGYVSYDINRTYNDVISETKVNFNNVMTYKMNLVSDYVNEQEYLLIKQLLASPMVYAQMNNETKFIPVTIELNDWVQKIQGVDKMFNIELTMQYGIQQTQLR
jgi:hypothetical protein